MNELKPSKRLFKNDLLLVMTVFLVSAMGALYLFVLRPEGNKVRVIVDGELLGVYSLSEDAVIEINNGDGMNKLVISDSKAYVEKANCPDGICSDHRAIYRNGESIICLPNKVVITVFTEAQSSEEPDIVA